MNEWPYGIIVRSSAVEETLSDRGSYDSKKLAADFDPVRIADAIEEIYRSYQTQSQEDNIALIIQPLVQHTSLGHISNEHRVSKTINQWSCEAEGDFADFRFNSQRTKAADIKSALTGCKKNGHKNVFRSVGRWCTKLNRGPCHIEWAVNGDQLWLLQIDFEHESPDNGVDPKDLLRSTDGDPPPNKGVTGIWSRYNPNSSYR